MDKTIIRPEPYGVVLIIGSWNYPLHISLAPLAGAISAGNCAVIKPSEISPHTAEAIEKLLPRYIDQDCFKYVFSRRKIKGMSSTFREKNSQLRKNILEFISRKK